jgi:metal-sulfur cluster biosynthetic enzyme
MPATAATLPDETAVRSALRKVVDPELGMNIVDLGLIHRIDIAPQRLLLEMTMTSPACPMGEMIVDDARGVLTELLPATCRPEIELVWDPPWDPSRMSAASRAHFGW